MLEACANQAIGLQAMALQASPRMLALASHGDQASELPLLWSLCSTLAELGYSYSSILQYYYPGTQLHNSALSQLVTPAIPTP